MAGVQGFEPQLPDPEFGTTPYIASILSHFVGRFPDHRPVTTF
jgi:hypothetical protein